MATRLLLASVALTILLVSRPSAVLSQTSSAVIELPSPSGKYAVGRIAYHWEDNSRTEQFSTGAQDHRELMVYVWYPADAQEKHVKHAEYLSGVSVIAANKQGQEMRDYWGNAWDQLRFNKVASKTLDAPPVAPGNERFPLVTFSPGLGVPVTAYTALIQEVVSHGYIVVSIEPTYEAPVVVFPDGRLVASLPEATGRHLPAPPGETREQFIKRIHAFDEPHINRWASDIKFCIDQLIALNGGGKDGGPFAGRVDTQNIAAWGHSFGGRAAARACQLDARIKACLNADGLGPDGPIFVFEGEALPSQPFLWMEVYHAPPTEAQLAPYGFTRKEWDHNHEVQLATNQQQLRACPGGSFHVLINTEGIGHSSFTDEPMIDATTKQEMTQAAGTLELLGAYTVAFFDKELKHANKTALDDKVPGKPGVSVERLGRAN